MLVLRLLVMVLSVIGLLHGAKTCSHTVVSNNETYILRDYKASKCSSKGNCEYSKEKNMQKGIYTKTHCLHDLDQPIGCSNLETGALCRKGKGPCPDECLNIHDCSKDPYNDWCECCEWRNGDFSSLKCIPCRAAILHAGDSSAKTCRKYDCEDVPNYTDFKFSGKMWSCCRGKYDDDGHCIKYPNQSGKPWKKGAFNIRCCSTMCRTKTTKCKNMLKHRFHGNPKSCEQQCTLKIFSSECTETSNVPCLFC